MKRFKHFLSLASYNGLKKSVNPLFAPLGRWVLAFLRSCLFLRIRR